MKSIVLLVLAAAGTCLPVSAPCAETSLRLDEAIVRAERAHPALIAERARRAEVQARAARADLPPPLVLGGEVENLAGSGALDGFAAAETTVRVATVLERGGKRAARRGLAVAEQDAQQGAILIMRLDVMERVTTRFHTVLAAQQRAAHARERVAAAEHTLREVGRWVDAGRNPESDLHQADIALVDAELEQEHADHELASAGIALAASWGSTIPDFSRVEGDLFALPPIASLDALIARLPMTADQQVGQLQAEIVRARRRLAESVARADLDVSLGIRRLEAFGDVGLVMSVAMPIGTSRRAGHAIAEADAQMVALEASLAAARIERHQALFSDYQELLHARTEFDAVRERMLPKAESALAFTRAGFESGRLSFQAMSQTQTTQHQLRRRAIDAAVRYHRLHARLSRLAAIDGGAAP